MTILLLHDFHCTWYAGNNLNIPLKLGIIKDPARSERTAEPRSTAVGKVYLQPCDLRESLLKCWGECPRENSTFRELRMLKVTSFFFFPQLLKRSPMDTSKI